MLHPNHHHHRRRHGPFLHCPSFAFVTSGIFRIHTVCRAAENVTTIYILYSMRFLTHIIPLVECEYQLCVPMRFFCVASLVFFLFPCHLRVSGLPGCDIVDKCSERKNNLLEPHINETLISYFVFGHFHATSVQTPQHSTDGSLIAAAAQPHSPRNTTL